MATTLSFAALLISVVAAFGSLAVAYQWILFFADWLWLIALAPKMTVTVSASAFFLVVTTISLMSDIPPDRSLAVSIALILTPFVAVLAANSIAFLWAWFQERSQPKSPWRTFIFDVRRQAQRESYEAPPTDRF
ncbi:MAG: hypothetical protein HEQ21_08185 [Blastomonas sp.]|uniref:hypothetical protein n=1 Tax=Blastomonas sp. TaxID=1909299 RepID=UPI0025870610|nr:hypothetical protein [Blastomonas sp.]MCO5792784.1 hypothetical protein [Blastomonas sp.]